MADDNQALIDALMQTGRQYPGLARYLQETSAFYGAPRGPNDDRQLEFYQPWERDNPQPGKNTIEVFNRGLAGQDLTNAIAGDLLHRAGSIDPRTGQPVDPSWHALKQQLGAARSPMHLQIDRNAYEREKATPYGVGSYQDWDQNNRLDAYIRAGLFPNQNPDWQRGGVLSSPGMQSVFNKMRNRLAGPGFPDTP